MNNVPQILIIDDDPGTIRVMSVTLEDVGETCFATSGEDGLRLLSRQPVDLVILDAEMPGMDGFSTCHEICDRFPELPVIFVTSATDSATEVRALETGAVDFISKPINPRIVTARVNTHLKLKQYSDNLRKLAVTDALTGVANRRALYERLESEWRRATRHGSPLSLLMIDVDFFKQYNDHYGHQAGDACLSRVAQGIAGAASRAGDFVARYGGEEFCVLLADTTVAKASAAAQRVCERIQALDIRHERSRASDRVTVSIGVAEARPVPLRPQASGETVSAQVLQAAGELFSAADKALYAAKRAGRNRVVGEPTP